MNARATVLASLALVGGLALTPSPSAAQQKKQQRDLVTREEIMESAQRNDDLATALRSLRPRFLQSPTGIRTLGNSQMSPTVVILDGKPMGDLTTLRTIVASSVAEVRYLEPSRAGTEFGNIANGGAVVVRLYKGPTELPKVSADSAKPAKPR